MNHPQERLFRLITLNTWKCDGDYPDRLNLIAREFNQEPPDILALQESFHSIDEQWNTARELATTLEMDYWLHSYRRKSRRVQGEMFDSYSGLAVLSRLKVVEQSIVHLPTVPEDGDRDAQVLVLATTNGTLAVVNLHLTHLRVRNDLRIQQLQYLLKECEVFGALPLFLCGDFNAPLSVFRDAELLGPCADLLDTWELAGGETPKPPTLHPQFREASKEPPGGSVDHILYRGPQTINFHGTARLLRQPGKGRGFLASDHMAVALDFSSPQ